MRFQKKWYVRPAKAQTSRALAQTDQSLCWSLKYSVSVKLLTEPHVRFLSLKVGCTGSSESTLVKMPHCWESHVAAQLCCSLSLEGSSKEYQNKCFYAEKRNEQGFFLKSFIIHEKHSL